jgi:hypothetical protein
MGYTLHAGSVLEPAPRGQQAGFRGNAAWFDFGACAVVTDQEGAPHASARARSAPACLSAAAVEA